MATPSPNAFGFSMQLAAAAGAQLLTGARIPRMQQTLSRASAILDQAKTIAGHGPGPHRLGIDGQGRRTPRAGQPGLIKSSSKDGKAGWAEAGMTDGRRGGQSGQCANPRHRRVQRRTLPLSHPLPSWAKDGVIVGPFRMPPALSSPFCSPWLMTVGLVFSWRAASKDRTTVVDCPRT